MADEKKGSRRHRRGQGSTANKDEGAAPRSSRQLDPQAFAQVDQMIGAFSQNRFGNVLPTVMAGFFGAAKRKEELRDPELQAAFMLFFVYGWKDDHGMRIVDAFAEYGPKLKGEQKRVLDALQSARLAFFRVEGSERGNKQLSGRDVLRDEPMIVLDHNAFETLTDGDALLAWFFPMGELARPFGVATQVANAKYPAIEAALVRLASALSVTVPELPDRKPAQTFWTVYRLANALIPQTEA
jgi:hypothetical protein